MHGTVMMFLFAVPVVEAIAVYLLPDMLGARDLPFPRLCAYAFWAYAIGGLAFFCTHLLRLVARRRLVHVPAADRRRALARPRRRLLAARHRLHRDLGDRRRHRADHRHPVHARARHDAGADAGLRLGDAGRRRHDRVRLPGDDRRHHAAGARARLRLALLRRRSAAATRCCGSTCSGSSATPRSTSSSCRRRAWCR